MLITPPPPPMFGHFTPEALHSFAEAHNLDTSNQNFSEGVFDFKMCQDPKGKRYGVSENEQCKPPAKQVTAAKGKVTPEKKKKEEKMCTQYQPWQIPALRMQIVPCKNL